MQGQKPVLYIITWDSWSGKTFLTEHLLLNGIKEILSFTTREIRDDSELDRYAFVTKEDFKDKEERGHFLETVEYKGNHYWLTKYLPKESCFCIVEPNGREQILEANIESHRVVTVFIKVDEKELEKRLKERDWNLNRMWDKFSPTPSCIILDWKLSPEENWNELKEV